MCPTTSSDPSLHDLARRDTTSKRKSVFKRIVSLRLTPQDKTDVDTADDDNSTYTPVNLSQLAQHVIDTLYARPSPPVLKSRQDCANGEVKLPLIPIYFPDYLVRHTFLLNYSEMDNDIELVL